jgi:alpha-tubulin suppressor-like RCC1 family protein
VSRRRWDRAGAAAIVVTAALGLTACKDTVEPLQLAGDPAVAAVSSGNNQSGAVGATLADSLVVLVSDAADAPVPGVFVNWTATGGTLSRLVDTTDGAGKSSVAWTLGNTSGAFTATATVAGLPPVTFTASASPVSGTLVFRYVDAGSYHACGITTDERAVCWGFNGDGQLMADSAAQTLEPTPAAGNLTFRMTSGGRYHSCGVTLSGLIYCAGANQDGRLLNKSQTPSPIPVQAKSPITFQLVSAGGSHTCAISLAQDAWCGGNNAEGELGDTTTFTHADTLRPVSTIGTVRYRTISAGGLHTCALTTSGVAQCWGYNLSGQLGSNTGQLRNFDPVTVSGGITFQVDPTIIPHAPDPDFYVPSQGFLSAGYAHTCGVAVGGTLYCWGNNDDGQLGRAGASSSAPSAVGGGLTFKAVSAGVRHTCGLTTAGLAYCWGNNDFGQLGNGTRNSSSAPVPVSLSLVFQSISAGETFTCGVTTGGVAYCWGDDEYGQLGVRGITSSLDPVKVAFQP